MDVVTWKMLIWINLNQMNVYMNKSLKSTNLTNKGK